MSEKQCEYCCGTGVEEGRIEDLYEQVEILKYRMSEVEASMVNLTSLVLRLWKVVDKL